MNVFHFSGNLGKDAEVKYLPNGGAVCEFSVAVKSGYGDKEKTNWVRCAVFGKRAEGQLPQYLTKGAQVAIYGELELQEWECQNGKGAALSVRVEGLDLIGSKSQANQQPAPQGQPQYNQAPPQGGYNQAPQQGYQGQQPAPQQGYNGGYQGQ